MPGSNGPSHLRFIGCRRRRDLDFHQNGRSRHGSLGGGPYRLVRRIQPGTPDGIHGGKVSLNVLEPNLRGQESLLGRAGLVQQVVNLGQDGLGLTGDWSRDERNDDEFGVVRANERT